MTTRLAFRASFLRQIIIPILTGGDGQTAEPSLSRASQWPGLKGRRSGLFRQQLNFKRKTVACNRACQMPRCLR